MSPMFEGFPAIIYSGLWNISIFNRLSRIFPEAPMKIAFLLTDSPPAFSVEIQKDDFRLEILEDITDAQSLDTVECDAYLTLPTETLYLGVEGIRNGITEGKVKIKNLDILLTLAKITGAL